MAPVSYTHLDVYKRQERYCENRGPSGWGLCEGLVTPPWKIYITHKPKKSGAEIQIKVHNLKLIDFYSAFLLLHKKCVIFIK